MLYLQIRLGVLLGSAFYVFIPARWQRPVRRLAQAH
jgi:hypothetical protein